MKKAEELFEAATAKDPTFARAYLGIAKAQISAISMTTTTNEESIPRIRREVEKAIELDPNLGEAHALLAYVDYVWNGDWSQAESEFRRALALGANAEASGQYGWSLTTRGRFSEAHEQLKLAAEQDPLSILPPFDEFLTYNFERDVAGEKKAIRQVLAIRPNFVGAHALNVVIYTEQHDCGAARGDAEWIEKNYPAVPLTQSVLAFASACANDRSRAVARIKKM